MKDYKTNIFGYGGSVMTLLFGASSGSQVFEIISIVLSIISFLVSIAFTLWKWYHRAKEDGKITYEEINELVNELDKIRKENDKNGLQ